MQKRVVLKGYMAVIVLSVMIALGLNNLLLVIDIAKYSKAYQETVKILYAPGFVQQLLSTGIVIPIVEELLFRGVAFRWMRKWMPFVWAMILSALLFGAYHGNLVQFVYATICGLYLAYLCEIFGSVLASILAHMAMNLTACIMTQFGWFSWIFEQGVRVWVVTLLCTGLASLLFLYIQKLDVTKMLKKDCK